MKRNHCLKLPVDITFGDLFRIGSGLELNLTCINTIRECILGKTHIKKCVFLVVGPLSFYPPYTNGLVVHATSCPKLTLRHLFPVLLLSRSNMILNNYLSCSLNQWSFKTTVYSYSNVNKL